MTFTNTPNHLDFCYLVLHPFDPQHAGASMAVPVPRDAPYFFELDLEYRSLRSFERHIDTVVVQISLQTINDQVWVADCRYRLEGALSDSMARQRQTINTALRRMTLAESGYTGRLVEEYTIVLISQFQQTSDSVVEQFGALLAQLIRVVERPLTVAQTQLILQSRSRYAEDDLTIVDWEGAIVISQSADFNTEIELLKIGNYQLLLYRVVDEDTDEQLKRIRAFVGRPVSWFSNRRETLRKAINRRLELMLDFENTDQSLLLIGDWYSAQLYRIIFDEFYIDEWKAIVSKKLENLSSITEIVQQDLTLSWSRLLDIIQLVGWTVLLIGYFYLFLRDSGVIH